MDLIASSLQSENLRKIGLGTAIVAATMVGKKIYDHCQQVSAISRVVSDKNINHPPCPKIEFAMDLSKSNCLHSCMPVFNITSNCWENSTIRYYHKKDEEEHLFLALSETGKQIGSLVARKYETMENGEFGCPALVFQMKPSYGNQPGEFKKIEITELKNEDQKNYKYVGYGLIKVVLQTFRDETDCRIELEAAWRSHTFYWKLGFRPNKDAQVQRIAAEVIKGRPEKDLGSTVMHLPDWARDAWKRHLVESPLPMV